METVVVAVLYSDSVGDTLCCAGSVDFVVSLTRKAFCE